MELLTAVITENFYIIILVAVLLLAILFAGIVNLLDFIDRIKKKIKEAEK